jgi:NhaP-type Na+/H+ or K+/H+ antiporter
MTAQHLLFLLGVPFFSVVVSALARRFDLNGPLVLVVVGLLVSVAPFIPDYDLEPEFVLMILLPPLLYQAAVETSVPSLRDNWSAVLILSVGMALVTTLLTGFAMHWLIPGMPLDQRRGLPPGAAPAGPRRGLHGAALGGAAVPAETTRAGHPLRPALVGLQVAQ